MQKFNNIILPSVVLFPFGFLGCGAEPSRPVNGSSSSVNANLIRKVPTEVVASKEIGSTDQKGDDRGLADVFSQSTSKSVATSVGAPVAKVAISFTGPAALLLDGDALTASLSRVFGTEIMLQNKFVTDTKVRDFLNLNPIEFFHPNQKIALGDVFPKIAAFSDRSYPFVNFHRKLEPDRDYLYALRMFLGAACQAKVTTEIKAPSTASNKIVSVLPISPEAVSRTMSGFFGYEPKSGMHRGSLDYADMMNALATTQKITAEEARAELFVQFCVSIGTDPRTFTR